MVSHVSDMANLRGPVMNDRSDNCGDLLLARSAAMGDKHARKKVTELVNPLVTNKNFTLCKKHCYGNNRRHHCLIDGKWGLQGGEVTRCDIGNASYLWMLEDLAGPNRLAKYEGRNGASLLDYLSFIANSREFLE